MSKQDQENTPSEFDLAFAEASHSDSGSDGDLESGGAANGTAEKPASSESAADEGATKTGDQNNQSGGQESSDSGDERKPAEKSDGKPEFKVADDIDGLKAQVQHLYAKERSSAGRVSAYQKRINDLQSKTQEIERRMAESLKTADPKFLEEFPEIGAAVQKMISAHTAELEKKLALQVAPLHEAQRYSQVQNEIEALREEHPDFEVVVKSKGFGEWFKQQPQQIRSLAKADTAAENAALLRLYKAQNPPVQDPQGAANSAANANQARLAQVAGISSKPGRAKPSGIPTDFDEAFEYAIRHSN